MEFGGGAIGEFGHPEIQITLFSTFEVEDIIAGGESAEFIDLFFDFDFFDFILWSFRAISMVKDYFFLAVGEEIHDILHKESTMNTDTSGAEDQSSLLVDPVLRFLDIETINISFNLGESEKG